MIFERIFGAKDKFKDGKHCPDEIHSILHM